MNETIKTMIPEFINKNSVFSISNIDSAGVEEFTEPLKKAMEAAGEDSLVIFFDACYENETDYGESTEQFYKLLNYLLEKLNNDKSTNIEDILVGDIDGERFGAYQENYLDCVIVPKEYLK